MQLHKRARACALMMSLITASSVVLAAPDPVSEAVAPSDDAGPLVLQSVWINPGVFSLHFNQGYGYRQDNWGIGGQLNFNHDLALLGGSFINSNDARSHDVGILWQPLEWGPFKIGAVGGGFDGYPNMENGAWFPAVLPMVSTSYERIGVNFSIVPNYKNRLHGAFVIQLIGRVW